MDTIAEKENVAPTTSSDPLNHKSMSPSPKKGGRKGRSKSIGPGSLDEPEPPTKQSSKDRRKSLFAPATKSILSRNEESERAARRKSMMNRRVSFAPEATLHTWDIVEYAKDHTTSTDSADSTRRTSSFGRSSSSPGPSSDASEEDEDAELLTPETAQQGSRKKRRSSGIPPMNFNNPDDIYSSSGVSESEESGSEAGDDVDSDGDTDTAMSLDVDDATVQSAAASDNSTASSDGLEQRLRQAAQMAGTRGIEYDEFGEISMELAAEEVTNAFKPWVQGQLQEPQGSASLDQENVNPFSPAFKAQVEEQHEMANEEDEEDEDMSMDVTRAVGGIIRGRREPASSPMTDGDGTMELTQAVGKITGQKRRRSTTEAGSPSTAPDVRPKRRRSSVARSSMGDDTMDLTMAVGGIMDTAPSAKVERRRSMRNRRSSGAVSQQEDASMDLTRAVGSIRSAEHSSKSVEDDSYDGNEELSMELTTVLGGIRPGQQGQQQPQLARDGTRPVTPQTSESPVRVAANTTPSQQQRFKDTPDLGAKQLLTPIFQHEAQRSDEKQTSSSKSKARASVSPVRHVEMPAPPQTSMGAQDIRVDSQGSPKAVPRQSATHQDIVYPDLALVEQGRPSSQNRNPDLNISRKTPSEKSETPGLLEFRLEAPAPPQSADKQRTSSPSKSTIGTPEKLDATDDAKDLTASIRLLNTPRKEALRSVTPRKQSAIKPTSPLKAATPKTRTTSKAKEQATELPSPVRRLHEDLSRIRANGENAESIGLHDFLARAGIRFMDLTTTKRRLTTAPTPSKARGTSENQEEVTFENSVVAATCTVPELELYQHACHELKRYTKEGKQMITELEATTLRDQPPLIKAYMHASPERKASLDAQMRDMKTDARLRSKELWYAWRSQLLNELLIVLSSIGEELIKDDEKLVPLQEILEGSLPGLTEKHALLQREADHLEEAINAVSHMDKEELNSTRQTLSHVNAELDEKRRTLERLRQQAEEQDSTAEHLQESKEEFTAAIQEANRIRDACRGVSLGEITVLKDSVKLLEDTFGWSITSASSSPATITMMYKSELQLFFHPQAFQQSSPNEDADRPNEAIRLSYVAESQRQKKPLTTTLRFFLQLLRASLQGLPQCTTKISDLLALVSGGWDTACTVAESERRLNVETVTNARIVSDEKLAIESTILLPKVRTKVRASIALQATVGPDLRVACAVEPRVLVVYGEQYNEKNMTEFLRGLMGKRSDNSRFDGWADAMKEMTDKLVARGAKGARK